MEVGMEFVASAQTSGFSPEKSGSSWITCVSGSYSKIRFATTAKRWQ